MRPKYPALALSLAVILFLALAFALSMSATAQGQPTPTKNPECKPAALIEKASKLTSAKDDKKDLDALLALSAEISAQNVACNGWIFSGDVTIKVIGPIDFPPGLYKATLITKGSMLIDTTSPTPNCDFLGMVGAAIKGDSMTGSERTLKLSRPCKVYLQPSLVDAPWTLTIEPLK